MLARLLDPLAPTRVAPTLALALVFAALYVALGYIQFYHWLLTSGLLFCALWALPRRRWPWLFVATILARVASGWLWYRLSGIHGPVLGHWQDWPQFLLGNVAEPFLVATGVLFLRDRPALGEAVDGAALARLHLGAGVSSLAVVAKDVLYVLNDGVIADVTRGLIHGQVPIGGNGAWELLLRFALKNALGCFVGIMLLAPLALWIAAPEARADSRRLMRRSLPLLLPTVAVFLALGLATRDPGLAEILRRLLLVVVLVAALRDGWRAAALAILTVSLAVAVDDHLGASGGNAILLQMFIAITGALGLLLGAAFDDLRARRAELTQMQAHSEQLSRELALSVERSLQSEEDERKRIAAEIHDEFGQNLTALQTRLRLLLTDFHMVGKSAALGELMDLARAMRGNIRGVLERLRPAALDELGLYGAIDRGSIRQLAEGAGLAFEVQLHGDGRLLPLLDDLHRIAAYRIVQEAVTNTVRHAYATRCGVRLRIERRHAAICLFLDIRDDGVGGDLSQRRGSGLTAMRDRVTTLGGRMHLHDLMPGLRVHAMLRQPLAP